MKQLTLAAVEFERARTMRRAVFLTEIEGRGSVGAARSSSSPRSRVSQWTRCWRELDSNLYGAFPVKRLFWVVLTVFCSERERPFFVPSPAIRFAERAEGVKGPKW